MSRLPAPSGRQLIAALKQLGFEVVRTSARRAATRFCATQTVAQPWCRFTQERVGRGLIAKILRDTELGADQLRNVL